MIYSKFLTIFCLIIKAFGLSLLNPESQRLMNAAKKLRQEAQILENELIQERKDFESKKYLKDNFIPGEKDFIIPKLFVTKIQTKNKLNLHWELKRDGETRLKILDNNNYLLGRALVKWIKKKSRLGIGHIIIFRGWGVGLSIRCKFISISRYEHKRAKHNFNKYNSNLKILNKDLDSLRQSAKIISNINPPKPIFPIISTESIAYTFFFAFRRFLKNLIFITTEKLILISIHFAKKDTQKWEKIVNIGNNNQYIKLIDDFYIINNEGSINIRGMIPIYNSWVKSPRYLYKDKISLEYYDIIKTRTGGRIGGVFSNNSFNC